MSTNFIRGYLKKSKSTITGFFLKRAGLFSLFSRFAGNFLLDLQGKNSPAKLELLHCIILVTLITGLNTYPRRASLELKILSFGLLKSFFVDMLGN